MVDLSTLDKKELEAMAQAGRDVMECHRVLAATQDNIVGELLKTANGFFEWKHYPEGDVYDTRTHSQFYYHAHAKGARDMEEHGHFHTFLRPKGMPDDVLPMPVPNFDLPPGANDALSHIIAISMDSFGYAQRLFTTNRWVTGEVWYRAEDVIRMLDLYLIDHAQPSWPVNKWLSAVVRLFKPQIIELLHERDRTIQRHIDAHPGRDVYEDRELEVTSELAVRVEDQIRDINDALKSQKPALKIFANG